MSVATAETALTGLFADLDGERWNEIAGQIEPDVELADELTGTWLRGDERVAAYLLAQRGVVTSIQSTLNGVAARVLASDLTLLTFGLTQVYLLDGEVCSEDLTGCVLFREVGGEQRLALLHLGEAGTTMPSSEANAPTAGVVAPRSLGQKIRQHRKASGVSLRALAKHAELSPSFLSQIERDQAEPSVQSLRRLTDALQVEISEILSDGDDHSGRRVTHAASRPRIALAGAGFTVHPFGTLQTGTLEATVVEIEPGGVIGDADRPWPGEQFVYVICGRLDVQDGRHVSSLATDDGVMLIGERPLRLACSGALSVRFLLVQSPGV